MATVLVSFIIGSVGLSFLINFIMVNKFGKYLLSHPNERSSHENPTPQSGGLGFVVAFGAMSLIWAAVQQDIQPKTLDYTCLWIIIISMVTVGVFDDVGLIRNRWISAPLRYMVHLGVAMIVINLVGPFPLPTFADASSLGTLVIIILSIIAFTAFINLYNFMDGLDGLVGGCSVVQLGFLAMYFKQPVLWLLWGALLGFLWWNWTPAKIFMGDTGSTVLGGVIAVSLLNGSKDPVHVYTAFPVVLPLIGDALYTLIYRLLKGQNIFKDHCSHLYQRLERAGWRKSRLSGMYVGINMLIALCILIFGELGAWMSVLLVIGGIAFGEYSIRTKTSSCHGI